MNQSTYEKTFCKSTNEGMVLLFSVFKIDLILESFSLVF